MFSLAISHQRLNKNFKCNKYILYITNKKGIHIKELIFIQYLFYCPKKKMLFVLIVTLTNAEYTPN